MIVSARGEPCRIVQEAAGGLCTEPGNPKALARAILTLRDDAEGRRQYALSGSRQVDARYSLRAMALKLEQVLLENAAR